MRLNPDRVILTREERQALTERQIEVMLQEYAQAIEDYRTWITEWRQRQMMQPRGFRGLA